MKRPGSWLLDWAVRRIASQVERDELDADLTEMYVHRAATVGERGARRWLRREGRRLALRIVTGRGPIRSARPTNPVAPSSPLRGERAGWSESLLRDVGFGLRQILRAPGWAALVILTLGIGIGSSTVVFSVVDAVLVQPLPYPDADRLVRLYGVTPEGMQITTSDRDLIDFIDRNRTFEGIAAAPSPFPDITLLDGGEPERLRGIATTVATFDVLGVEAALGRTFVPEEGQPGAAHRVTILSHGLWQRRFGGDPGLIGRTLTLDGEAWTVVGVLPEGFQFMAEADLWIPFAPPAFERGDRRLEAFGRLLPGVTPAQARDDLLRIARDLGETFPESNAGYGVQVIPFRDWIVDDGARRATLVLAGAVGLLLLLACANVSNLWIARAIGRRREIGVRRALGAGRGRIARQLLTESVVLAGAGAAVGVLIAVGSMPLIRRLDSSTLPRIDRVSLDLTVLGFALLVTVGAGLLSGLAPALGSRRDEGAGTLREGRSGVGDRARRVRDALVVGELALATVLLVVAGLLLTSFRTLRQVNPGYSTENVLTAEISLPENRYPEFSDPVVPFYRDVLERLSSLPGVTSVGATAVNPFVGLRLSNTIGTEAMTDRSQFVQVQWRSVTAGFFTTVGVRVVRGRTFDDRDREGERRAVVSALLADRLWPGEDPIGKRLQWIQPGGRLLTVIGVVDDVRDVELAEEPRPTLYYHHEQFPWPHLTLMIRTAGDPSALASQVRREIWAVDPAVPVPDIRPLGRVVATETAGRRFNALLTGLFAAVALLLASMGIYGVVSYSVARRTREIGLRMALGAREAGVVGMVLRRGLFLVLAGLALGTAAALASTRVLESLLFETPPTDPATYALVGLVLALVGTAATLVPAARAARVDPLVALRDE